MPAGPIEVKAMQTFQMLQPWAQSLRTEAVDDVTVDVQGAEHAITLKIPAPPADEELLQRH